MGSRGKVGKRGRTWTYYPQSSMATAGRARSARADSHAEGGRGTPASPRWARCRATRASGPRRSLGRSRDVRPRPLVLVHLRRPDGAGRRFEPVLNRVSSSASRNS